MTRWCNNFTEPTEPCSFLKWSLSCCSCIPANLQPKRPPFNHTRFDGKNKDVSTVLTEMYCNCNLFTSFHSCIHFLTSSFISCHFVSFPFISFHFSSFHSIPFYSIQFNSIPFHSIQFHFISFHFISFHFISCHVMSCHVMSFLFNPFHCNSLQFISFHPSIFLFFRSWIICLSFDCFGNQRSTYRGGLWISFAPTPYNRNWVSSIYISGNMSCSACPSQIGWPKTRRQHHQSCQETFHKSFKWTCETNRSNCTRMRQRLK